MRGSSTQSHASDRPPGAEHASARATGSPLRSAALHVSDSSAAPTGWSSSKMRFPGRSSSAARSEEHTSELQSRSDLVCRLLLEKKKNKMKTIVYIRYCKIA